MSKYIILSSPDMRALAYLATRVFLLYLLCHILKWNKKFATCDKSPPEYLHASLFTFQNAYVYILEHWVYLEYRDVVI